VNRDGLAKNPFQAVIPEVLNRESSIFRVVVTSLDTRLRGYDDF
jgi:hypothetical protein